MVKDVYYGKTLRKSFARYEEIMEMPNLLEVQKTSYKWFLETGLREVFKETDAVTDYSGNLELSFIDYSMDEKPKYTEEELKEMEKMEKERQTAQKAALKAQPKYRSLHYIDEDDYEELPEVKAQNPNKNVSGDRPEIKD